MSSLLQLGVEESQNCCFVFQLLKSEKFPEAEIKELSIFKETPLCANSHLTDKEPKRSADKATP